MKKKFAFIVTITAAVFCFTSLLMCKTQSEARTIKGIRLENFTNITKYDVTGDGKADTVRIDCKKRYEKDGMEGDGWKITVNGKIVYKQKSKETGCLTVMYYPMAANRLYLDVEEIWMGSENTVSHGLYIYDGTNLKLLNDFYNSVQKNTGIECSAQIKSMSPDKMVLTCTSVFIATSGLTWDMVYQYSKGKWRLSGNTYNVTDSVNAKKAWTSKKTIACFKKPGGKGRAFTLKAGDKVQIKKICLKAGKTYMQAVAGNGKKGWFISPNKVKNYMDMGFFKECMFAG